MPKSKRVNVTEGSVNRVLRDLAAPMILGILGMVAFNLTDTYFVSRLGTVRIAALSFTFPVVLIVSSINLGIGIGTAASISKSVGENEKEKVKRLATDSLLLGFVISLIIISIGLLTIKPLFSLLGAQSDTMPYIQQYMSIWYLGVPFVVVPMIGNNAIRALGDTKTPSFVMLFAALMNIILDPLMIFGIGIFPELGVRGAALATVISRAMTFVFALYILIIREKVIIPRKVPLNAVLTSWKTILFIGVPSAIAKMIIPLGTGIITGIIAQYGSAAVAGYGIATKIELFLVSILRALTAIIPIFVGQNFGAKKFERIRQGFISSEKFSFLYSFALYAILFVVGRPIALLFTKDENVINIIVEYLKIVPLGYGFMGVVQIINGVYNALQKPIKAASVNLIQMLLIYVPLAVASSKYFGVSAIFLSLVISYALVSTAGHVFLSKDIKKTALAVLNN